ncbi:MAG TPA: sugar MFS transporter [Candidatus Methylacidiphilales bacterium]|jgi:FHS family L-fucose permease-like MFS transporter|nr:sugar MFS transporter [Candidatus Methylacidiphilales bacterium]
MKSFLEMFRVNGKNYALTFALVSTLFFLWGFCNGMIDVLNKHFQNSLHISKAASGFVQFANFIGYFVMAIPSGLMAQRFGYKGGILIGLALIASGAFFFIPATWIGTFAAFLTCLFILATGLTILETIANPYTTVLGPPISGAARINLAQTCNALGTFFGPLVAGAFILSSTGEVNTSNSTLFIPYLFIAALVVVLIVLFWKAEIPDLQGEDDSRVEAAGTHAKSTKPLLARWHFTLAVGAQFFYVAAQIGVWGFFINFVTSSDMPNLPEWLAKAFPSGWTYFGVPKILGPGGHLVDLANAQAAWHVTDLGGSKAFAGGILCFLVGRFIGSMILRVCSAHLTLAIFGLINTIMMVLVVLPLGWISVAALFLSCFFMSIMYPTIFALGIRGLGAHTKFGSSLIVMAIVGGAIMPYIMGKIADLYSMRIGFTMPLFCFAYVMVYAAIWPALERLDTGHHVAD